MQCTQRSQSGTARPGNASSDVWESNVKNVLQDEHLANAIQQTSGLYKVVNGAMSEYMCQMFERDLSAANNVTDLLSTTHADNTNVWLVLHPSGIHKKSSASVFVKHATVKHCWHCTQVIVTWKDRC